MAIEHINPPTVNPPLTEFSQVTKMGNILFIAGQIATDMDKELLGVGDAEKQFDQTFKNVHAILKHFSADWENVVKLNTYFVHSTYRPAFVKMRKKHLKPPYPSQTVLVVSALAEPEYICEIDAIAVLE